MKKYDLIKSNLQDAFDGIERDAVNLEAVASESRRVAGVARNAGIIIEDIDRKFEKATGLNRVDVSFVFFATALQCVRQYLLTQFEKPKDDKASAKDSKKKEDDVLKKDGQGPIDREHGLYRPPKEEIILNPVPYDAIYGSREFDLGLGGKQHRFKTLGHDPLLGWVFGTANITTSTLTTFQFKSYHIKTGAIPSGAKRDKIVSNADTWKVFDYTKRRLHEEPDAIAIALFKQAMHLRSDKGSKLSLPIPVISTISPDAAQKLSEYGLNIGNLEHIGKQAAYAMLINTLIAMIHGMLYDEAQHGTRRLYEVKTRKILSYSNTIASVSNVIQCAFRVYCLNDPKAVRSLDVGGILVTIYRLVSDYRFISQVKEEFLAKQFYDVVVGSEYNF